MKVWVVAIFFLTKFAYGQEIVVSSIKHPEADFTHYVTYNWAVQVDYDTDDESYFLDDLMFKSDIREAVRNSLESLGYRPDATAPDLIVNFRVFEKKTMLNGFEGYGVNYWNPKEYSPESGRRVDVNAGTIILSIVDRRQGVLVWEGVASGLVTQGEFVKEEGKLREAVDLMMNQYGTRANEYTKR